MSEVVNLRMARKRKARAGREEAAARNRVSHGMGKAQKAAAKAESERTTRFVDGHFRCSGKNDTDGPA